MTERKNARSINAGKLESQSLALVNGDRPSCFQRILTEGAGNGFGDFLCFGINRVFHIVPDFLFDDDLVSFL